MGSGFSAAVMSQQPAVTFPAADASLVDLRQVDLGSAVDVAADDASPRSRPPRAEVERLAHSVTSQTSARQPAAGKLPASSFACAAPAESGSAQTRDLNERSIESGKRSRIRSAADAGDVPDHAGHVCAPGNDWKSRDAQAVWRRVRDLCGPHATLSAFAQDRVAALDVKP